LARWLLAPSPDGVDNLLAEGAEPERVHLVGNVMVDTLLANRGRAEGRSIRADLGVDGRNYALLTLHRPATVDDPTILAGVMAAIIDVGERLPVVFPVHPRTRARLGEAHPLPASIVLTDPLGYLDFLALQASATVVLTDSGGVQEETTVLGVPCLTLRDNHERPITITEGTNRLFGRDPARIRAAVDAVLEAPPAPRRPALWDGHAAERIVDALLA
jgi:UDP-N-acetylglucosamine 2-epimerase (non-hydrolysing)